MPFEEEAANGWATMCANWAEKATEARSKIFTQALENWKENGLILRSLGKPVGEPPAIPELVSCDWDLAKKRYLESLLTGDPIVVDYFEYAKMPVPPEAFVFGEETPGPVPADQVLGPDGPHEGWFLVVNGVDHPHGFKYTHPVYGKLTFWKYPGFGNVMQKRWKAA